MKINKITFSVALIGSILGNIVCFALINNLSIKISTNNNEYNNLHQSYKKIFNENGVLTIKNNELKARINYLIESININNVFILINQLPKKIEESINNEFETLGYDSKVSITSEIDQINNDEPITEVNFALNPPIYFETGKYVLTEYDKKLFLAAIVFYLDTLTSIMEIRNDIIVECAFYGGADNTPLKSGTRYLGDLGPIDMEDAIVNGHTQNVKIFTGQVINNSDFACLRAYALYVFLLETFKKSNITTSVMNSISFRFYANEYTNIGNEYRYAKVKIKTRLPDMYVEDKLLFDND